MPEPATVAVLAGITTALNSSVTFARFVYELKNTPVDVKTCLDLVARVDEDIQYAISLRGKHLTSLSITPTDLARLDRIISSANQSIFDVGRLLEGCRREAHDGQVPMIGRMKWVMSDSTAFGRRTANLQQQHAAINVEIGFLRQLEALQPMRDLLSSNTIFENPELLSMGRRNSTSKLPNVTEMDLIDMNPSPPEYAPPVPPRSPNDLMFPEFVYEMPTPELILPRASDSCDLAAKPAVPAVYVEVDEEEDDPEVAFYREMRQQEEERRRRFCLQR